MCSKRYLQCASCGCICMAHEPCQQRSKGRAPQPRARTVAAIRSSAGCRRTNEEGFRCLSSASISLSPAGRASETTPSRRRHQDRFYRETFASIGSAPSRFREPHRFVVERDRESGIACGFAAEKKAWLDGLHSTATRFNSNIASIVCSLKNSSKSTNSSCLPYVDRLDLWNLIRCRRR